MELQNSVVINENMCDKANLLAITRIKRSNQE